MMNVLEIKVDAVLRPNKILALPGRVSAGFPTGTQFTVVDMDGENKEDVEVASSYACLVKRIDNPDLPLFGVSSTEELVAKLGGEITEKSMVTVVKWREPSPETSTPGDTPDSERTAS